MRVVLITGMSGAGKSVVIRLLEDLDYYCVDNLPARLLNDACAQLAAGGHRELAVSIDARSDATLSELPALIEPLRGRGYLVEAIFLTASTAALVQRFSETRRRHPLALRLTRERGGIEPTLTEAIEAERSLLEPLDRIGHTIDTSGLQPKVLRQWVRDFVGAPRASLTLAFESFAFKNGLPIAADLVFDVRNLPNPHYERELRPLTGLDAPVADFLAAVPEATAMIDDIAAFVARWLPSYVADGRHYLTVAVGCTGGQHRSPYVVEQLARRFAARAHVLARHRALAQAA